MQSVKRNDKLELVELPKEKKIVGSKWVYKTKYKANGSVKRYK